MLLKLDLGRNITIYKTFYDTKKYEFYCFCPIFKLIDLSIINNEKNQLIETDYFLVGGFNIDKKKSLIKLFKVNYSEQDFEKTEIEYIVDIEIENNFNNKFYRFKGQITCITQFKNNGKILVSFSDGNLHILNYPDIS